MYFCAERIADLDKHKMWTDQLLSAKAPFSSYIMSNNILVCFLMFASGISGGIYTLKLLFQNGLMLGVIGVICAQHHMSLSLWSFIASHGALELPSIVFAGAAGLRLGAGILFPGQLKWKDSVAKGGLEAVQLISGVIPLLIVAGSFEAFLSPTHINPAIKFTTGAILFTSLCVWLSLGGQTAAIPETQEI